MPRRSKNCSDEIGQGCLNLMESLNMSYFFDRFEYICPENHLNQFEIAYFVNQSGVFGTTPHPARLPSMLPCSGCNYELVPASLVPQLHCNYSELDFGKFQDAKYVESCAYHEAGHAVIAAVQQMPLKAGGIRIDQKGSGFSHYQVTKLSGCASIGPDPEREKAIRSTQAGYIAQEKFYLRFFDRLPPSGSSHDSDYIRGLLEEMYSGRNDFFDAMNKLAGETQQLVGEHWQAIEALAQTLLKKEWESQAPPSGERRWSTQLAQKKMDGSEIVALLQQHQISASVQP